LPRASGLPGRVGYLRAVQRGQLSLLLALLRLALVAPRRLRVSPRPLAMAVVGLPALPGAQPSRRLVLRLARCSKPLAPRNRVLPLLRLALVARRRLRVSPRPLAMAVVGLPALPGAQPSRRLVLRLARRSKPPAPRNRVLPLLRLALVARRRLRVSPRPLARPLVLSASGLVAVAIDTAVVGLPALPGAQPSRRLVLRLARRSKPPAPRNRVLPLLRLALVARRRLRVSPRPLVRPLVLSASGLVAVAIDTAVVGLPALPGAQPSRRLVLRLARRSKPPAPRNRVLPLLRLALVALRRLRVSPRPLVRPLVLSASGLVAVAIDTVVAGLPALLGAQPSRRLVLRLARCSKPPAPRNRVLPLLSTRRRLATATAVCITPPVSPQVQVRPLLQALPQPGVLLRPPTLPVFGLVG